jgi:alpha-N-arabinofuranosidase
MHLTRIIFFPGFCQRSILALAALTGVTVQAQSSAVMTIQADQPGAVVGTSLFGILFEEINIAGEGGLCAEMIRNYSYHGSTSPLYWTLVAQGSAAGVIPQIIGSLWRVGSSITGSARCFRRQK